MFWSDWGVKPKIERASMDGSHRKTLISQKLGWPNGLAIDFEKKRLYWADGSTHKIEYCDFEGNGRKELLSDSKSEIARLNNVFSQFVVRANCNFFLWSCRRSTSLRVGNL